MTIPSAKDAKLHGLNGSSDARMSHVQCIAYLVNSRQHDVAAIRSEGDRAVIASISGSDNQVIEVDSCLSTRQTEGRAVQDIIEASAASACCYDDIAHAHAACRDRWASGPRASTRAS